MPPYLTLFLCTLVTLVQCDIQFSPHIQSHMVLQRAPYKSSVYGNLSLDALGKVPVVAAKVTSVNGTSYGVSGNVIGNDWIVHLKPTERGGSYKITVTCLNCSGEHNTASIVDVTFGDVWFCSGQSNMAQPLRNTISRNMSIESIRSGEYSNIRIYSLKTNMNDYNEWMSVQDAAVTESIKISPRRRRTENTFFAQKEPQLMSFSSTCYYFAESLTDFFQDDAPPIGLINVAESGSRIQRWMSQATLEKCSDIDNPDPYNPTQGLYDSRVLPFANMTVKGFLWYQGESNMGETFGNVLKNRGYSCALSRMIAEWRATFSAVPGTTDPQAPFGIVTLTMTGAEANSDIGGMYWSQTGNHGILPNDDMPNTFLAQGFDLDDPYMNFTCYFNQCVPMNETNPVCAGCEQFSQSLLSTPFYPFLGPLTLHPRNKKPVAHRLAQAAYGSVYGGNVPVRGPVLSGCQLEGNKLIIKFNQLLLGDDEIEVGDYYKPTNASYLQILTKKDFFCLQAEKIDSTTTLCLDDGTGKSSTTNIPHGNYSSLDTWPMIPVTVNGPTLLTADVSGYEGRVFAVRYAWMYGSGWHMGCCSYHAPTSGPCPMANCPLKGMRSQLPVNPFVAAIDENGKCKCFAPQVCDE